MISQRRIQKLHEKFSELKKKGKTIRESAGKIVPGKSGIETIYVQTLFEGDNGLSSKFIDACENLCVKAKFEYMPITKAIDAELPLILISDDTEIDNEIVVRLEKRKRTDAPTFPLIIFSDEYFILGEGEGLSYVQTCDTLQDKSERPVMPFRLQDFLKQRDILSLYIECVVQTSTLYSLKKSLEAVYEKNVRRLEEDYKKYTELPNAGDMGNMLKKLDLNSDLRVLAGLCAESGRLVKNIRIFGDELDGFVNLLHEEYDRHIDSVITHKTTDDSSAYSVKLDLIYGALNGYLKKMCTDAERGFSQEELRVNLSEIVSDTRSAITSEAAELAFIGTFSSGKTTLINTLLGHRHKLRTSGAHNTAVLMELLFAQDEEHYEIVYKDILKWDLINYNSFENRNIVNTFDCDARIVSVGKNRSGSTIVHYQAVKGNDVRVAEIGSGHRLAVKKGSVVKSKGSFIEWDVSKSVVKLCSLNELNYIEKLISSKSVSDIKISTLGGEIRSEAKIQQIIARMKSFYSNLTRNYIHPTINVDALRKKWGGDFNNLEKCTFECKLSGFEKRSVVLDDAGWDRFMGNEVKSMAPFCESPECYMPAKVVKVYINSEFLKYCSITDTPGFGSITDEHDAITERYLRDSNGKLVVMIAINNHSFDMKLDDLLHNISGVFKNFRESQMDEVCFVLNCFTNLLPFEQCKKNVKEIQDKIRTLGFTNNEIYVDNLKQVLDSNTDKRVFIEPFPAYYSFKGKCLNDFLKTSIDKRYEKLRRNWDGFFRENISWLGDRIDRLTETLNSREKRVLKLNNTIRQIESVEIDTGECLVNEMRKWFDEFFDCIDSAFRGNRKGFFIAHRWNAVIGIFDLYKKESETWVDKETDLVENMSQAFRGLSFYAGERDIEESDFKPSHRLIVATFEKTQLKLKEADDNTNLFNKKRQSDYYMSQLHDIINQDKEQTTANIRVYCRQYKQRFDEKKQFLLNNFRDELEKSSNRDALQEDIRRFRELRGRLQAFRTKHFDVIKFNN